MGLELSRVLSPLTSLDLEGYTSALDCTAEQPNHGRETRFTGTFLFIVLAHAHVKPNFLSLPPYIAYVFQ